MPASEFTGLEVDTSSEKWRHECEIRWLLSLPDVQERRDQVNGVFEKQMRSGKSADVCVRKGIRQHRGDAEADRVIEDLRKLHALRVERQKPAQPAA